MAGYGETAAYGDLPYKGEALDESYGVLLQLMPYNIINMSTGAFKQISESDNINRHIPGSVFDSSSGSNYQILKMLLPN